MFAKSKHCRKAKERVSLICYRLEMFFPLVVLFTPVTLIEQCATPHHIHVRQGLNSLTRLFTRGFPTLFRAKKHTNANKNDLNLKYVSCHFFSVVVRILLSKSHKSKDTFKLIAFVKNLDIWELVFLVPFRAKSELSGF